MSLYDITCGFLLGYKYADSFIRCKKLTKMFIADEFLHFNVWSMFKKWSLDYSWKRWVKVFKKPGSSLLGSLFILIPRYQELEKISKKYLWLVLIIGRVSLYKRGWGEAKNLYCFSWALRQLTAGHQSSHEKNRMKIRTFSQNFPRLRKFIPALSFILAI